jgi:two-component system, chemotaxis family, sensor kinase CheA
MRGMLRDTFREEAQEILAEFEGSLLELEDSPGDRDAIGRVFRALHTIKGAGGLAGFDEMAGFAHEVETVYEAVRAGQVEVSASLISLSLAAGDQLQRHLQDEELTLDDPQAVALIAALRRHLPSSGIADLSDGRSLQPVVRQEHAVTYRIRFRPPADLFQRGLNPVGLLRELASLGSCRSVAQIDGIPSLDQLDPLKCYLYWDIILTTGHDINAIRDIFLFVEGESQVDIERIDDAVDHDGDYKRLGEILVERGDLKLADLRQLLDEKKRLGDLLLQQGLISGAKLESALLEQQSVQDLRRQREAQDSASSIRVRSDRLDKLVDLIGELVTVQARLTQTSQEREDSTLLSIAEEVERLTWDLRDQVLGIRMLPIGATFSRLRRLVRDLCDELGKEVDFTFEGADTELDKTVIERLSDPLIHLVRNALDHGIESPNLRQSAGKNPRGSIHLAARQAGPQVEITITDDGAGLDPDKIKKRALELGLITPQAELSAKEIYTLVFHSGLSTADEVTNISGRGVGMDVVRQAVLALRATVDVDSQLGRGTTITIRLPLTLAIIDGLLVRIAGDFYVLPLSCVEECIELRAATQASQDRHLVHIRGEIVPYIRLREQFAVVGKAPEVEQVVITRNEASRIGFVVDEVIGSHQTVIKPLGNYCRGVKGLAGATILGNGTVALILDTATLIGLADEAEKKSLAS